jgi:ABC-2 type transport system ATP-binding protein
MSAKVSIRDLRKSYGRAEAVRGVSFEIQDGEIFGMLGPNGAGKTTTLECVIGLREPDSGTIEVCGIDARKDPQEVKQRIGAALQTTSLQDKITGREALELFGAFYRKRVPAADLLKRVSLEEKADAPFDTLSGGQKQRLALALAFVNRPELVFLDEPTTGLDPQSRRELHGEIARMKRDGHTVLLTTHYIEEAEQLCDRIAIVDHGRIIATGAPKDLIAASKLTQPVSFETTRPVEAAAFDRLTGITELSVEGVHGRFRTQDISRALPELIRLLEARQVQLAGLVVGKITLEDVFIELTGSKLRE